MDSQKINIKKEQIVWSETDNADATRTVYHGYYPRVRKNCIWEEYDGNAALCNKSHGISKDGDGFVKINEVEDSGLKRNEVCKRCLKIYDKLK